MIRTALIVEDSPTQAQIITRMIEQQGWTTLHFPTLGEASGALSQVSIQALFLDVFVGMHNSLAHIERFRRLTPGTPIILMTAGASHEAIEETLKKARHAKADFVLRKPFSQTQVQDVFERAFQDPKSLTRRRHILIIDDSQTVRSFTRTILAASGHRVSEAASMEEAFNDVDIAHVDCILCDIFMPGMGGLKGMRLIKEAWPKVSLVAMSAGLENQVSETDALNATRRIGADAQIKKPFTPESLCELMNAILLPPVMIG